MLGTPIVSSYLSKTSVVLFVYSISLPVSNHNKLEQIFLSFTIIPTDT